MGIKESMQETFQVRQELGFLGFMDAHCYDFMTSRWFKRFWVLLFILFCVLELVLMVCIPHYRFSLADVLEILFPMITIGVAVIMVALINRSVIYFADRNAYRTMQYEFNHWGMIRNDLPDRSIPWRLVWHISESRNYFLVYLNRKEFYIVSKRQFPDRETGRQFRSFLLDRVYAK